MKKNLLILLLIGMMTLLLTACGCEHTWADATCLAPKTCTQCQKTEGEVADHNWADATCLTPKTCTVCSAAEGEAAGHIWEDATCMAPQTCTVCSATEGKVAEHVLIPEYLNGNVVTGTCTVCEKAAEQTTDDADAVALQILAGQWTAFELRNGGSGTTEDIREYNLVFEFREDGTATSAIPLHTGPATVSHSLSDQRLMRFEMTINEETTDVWIMPDTPNQITVWIPGYYSVFICEKTA